MKISTNLTVTTTAFYADQPESPVPIGPEINVAIYSEGKGSWCKIGDFCFDSCAIEYIAEHMAKLNNAAIMIGDQ